MANSGEADLKLGFLTTIELPAGGFVGGLLVTNQYGRPLEFQCTTPVRPNRTQEILYGVALRPFLFGEIIGTALLDKAAVKPDLVLADTDELLELRGHIPQPVALVDVPRKDAGTKDNEEDLAVGRQRLRFHEAHPHDRGHFASSAGKVPEKADLLEPFERVREALQETLKAGGMPP